MRVKLEMLFIAVYVLYKKYILKYITRKIINFCPEISS